MYWKTYRSVKSLDVALQEVSASKANRTLAIAAGMKEAIDVDAIRRELRPRVAAALQHLEERLDILTIARKPASHANDGNRYYFVRALAIRGRAIHLVTGEPFRGLDCSDGWGLP